MKKKKVTGRDRIVVAAAQFRTGAGAMKVPHKDPKHLRRQARQEEKKGAQFLEKPCRMNMPGFSLYL